MWRSGEGEQGVAEVRRTLAVLHTSDTASEGAVGAAAVPAMRLCSARALRRETCAEGAGWRSAVRADAGSNGGMEAESALCGS